MYSIVARSDPPTLTCVTTTAVSTVHNPCNGRARTLDDSESQKAGDRHAQTEAQLGS